MLGKTKSYPINLPGYFLPSSKTEYIYVFVRDYLTVVWADFGAVFSVVISELGEGFILTDLKKWRR